VAPLYQKLKRGFKKKCQKNTFEERNFKEKRWKKNLAPPLKKEYKMFFQRKVSQKAPRTWKKLGNLFPKKFQGPFQKRRGFYKKESNSLTQKISPRRGINWGKSFPQKRFKKVTTSRKCSWTR